MKLTDKACKNAQPREKPYKLADGGGLYLLVQPDGAKYWRLKYYYLGREKLLALGVYDMVSLAEAREGRVEAKKLVAAGKDPSRSRQELKIEALRAAGNTFKALALEWIEKQRTVWSEGHYKNTLRRLELDIFPFLGIRPAHEITPPELLEVLRKIEKRGALELVARVKQTVGQIFRYGIATSRCERDPSADLKGAFTPARPEHFASLDITEIPGFLKALEKNDARLYSQTRRATEFLLLTFVRTIEMRGMERAEARAALETGQWIIPAGKMKMERDHVVPLSRQALDLLRWQMEDTAHLKTKWAWPSMVRPQEQMSEGTVLGGLKRMGYRGRMTGHGFRALAMTTLQEKLGYAHKVIDRQLAHVPHSKVDRAYDRAKFIDERTKMMQDWANYLDAIKADPKKAGQPFKSTGHMIEKEILLRI